MLKITFSKGGRRQTANTHARDELYVVATGPGNFVSGDESQAFAPGDLSYVKAGVEHRFIDFSEDFATWVIFLAQS